MTVRGVPAGANVPSQKPMSKPASPLSATVGTSGKPEKRAAVLTASARILPALICGNEVIGLLNIYEIWPPSRSAVAGACPL